MTRPRKILVVMTRLVALCSFVALFVGSGGASLPREPVLSKPVPKDPRSVISLSLQDQPVREIPSAPGEKSADSIALSYRYRVGDTTRVALGLRQEMTVVVNPEAMGLGEGTPDVRRLVLRPEGEIETVVYAVDPSEVWLGARFRKISVGTEGGPAQSDGDLKVLREEFLMRLDRQGRMLEFVFPTGTDPQVALLLRGLLLPFQVVLPEAERGVWNVMENDASGRYRARYLTQRHAGQEGQKLSWIHKSFGQYESLFGEGTESARVDSRARATFDLEAGLVRSMDVTCSMEMRSEMMGHKMETSLRGTLRLLSRGRSDLGPRALVCRLVRLRKEGFPVVSGAELTFARMAGERENQETARSLEGVEMEDLLRVFVANEESTRAHSREEYEALQLMIRLFSADEEAVGEVLGLLAEGALKDACKAREKLQEELDEGKLKLQELRSELSDEKDDGDAVLSDGLGPQAATAAETERKGRLPSRP